MADKIVQIVEPCQIRDDMMDFSKAILATNQKEDLVDVRDMLYWGGKMYLGPDSQRNLDFVKPVFEFADKRHQYLFFRSTFW
jgi:hypothetical protein